MRVFASYTSATVWHIGARSSPALAPDQPQVPQLPGISTAPDADLDPRPPARRGIGSSVCISPASFRGRGLVLTVGALRQVRRISTAGPLANGSRQPRPSF